MSDIPKAMVKEGRQGIFCQPCGTARGMHWLSLRWYWEVKHCTACGKRINNLGQPMAGRQTAEVS